MNQIESNQSNLIKWQGSMEEMIDLAKVVKAIPTENGFSHLLFGDELIESSVGLLFHPYAKEEVSE